MGRIVNFVGLCRAPAVLVVVLLVWAAGAQATIINVPDDFGTIQAAIDAAAVGDTVLVQAGSYDEALVVDRSLTLLGANAGIHPAVGTHPSEVVGSRGPESILNHAAEALQPTAADVSVDGFQFTGGGGRIVTTSSDADNFQVSSIGRSMVRTSSCCCCCFLLFFLLSSFGPTKKKRRTEQKTTKNNNDALLLLRSRRRGGRFLN